VRVILGEESHLTILRHEVDRASFEKRRVALRPFFYPISLHPKFARLLVNMTGVMSGETLLDPFCGTGGVLIEAGLVEAHPVGSDLKADMVEGCGVNLAKFGVEANLFPADVKDLKEHVDHVDAIATDPPYGRSTTMGDDIGRLYSKSFEVFTDVLRKEGRLSIIVPKEHLIELGKEYMELEASHSLRVHKSLTRHFCLFRN
jgi:tRNA (guanine10-N2)-dimethyltransferase